MADVRALLKAKRQEARINHPHAAYGANGALRCTACGVAVKFASAWEGHLGSKSHRVAVANLKAKAEQSARATTTTLSKRKAEEGPQDDDDDDEMRVEVVGSGRKEEVEQLRSGKRQRTEEREVEVEGQAQAQALASRAFPANFFSDPSRAPPRDGEREEDEEMMDQDQETTTSTAAPKSQFDMEWDAFEREMQQPPPVVLEGADAAGAEATVVDPLVVHARATIAAEPELVSGLVGLPAGTQGADGAADGAEGRKAVAMSEEEGRKRKEMDERELIMDRFVEEERAQEDAYGRVALLRNKVQMLKQKRQLAKAKGDKADMQT